jgi:tRNA dimethylallyltransferase
MGQGSAPGSGTSAPPVPPVPPVPPLVVIGGPTATGKTDLAIDLALALASDGRPAEVISADSRQVYRGMDVGTAKPTLAERQGVPHHGLDLVEPDVPFSVSEFADHVATVLPPLAARGGVAVLVGGTGFWLRAIARGLALDDLPHDLGLRAELEAALATDGPPALAARLQDVAPLLAERTDLRNPRRVVRALEIATLRGDRPLPGPRGYAGPVTWILLDVADRALHRRWIAARSERQLDGGILPEAAALRERFGEGLRAFSSIGYREAWDLLDGRIDRAGYLAANTQRNVDFARRQRTWFRRERADLALDTTAGRATLLDAARGVVRARSAPSA